MALADIARSRTVSRTLERSQGFARRLADAEPWVVVPLLLMGLMAPRLLAPALGVAAAFWGVRKLAWGRLTAVTVADAPLALLVLMLPVTLWVTALPAVTREQVLWLLSGIALFYVTVNWVRSAGHERGAVFGFVGIGVLAALLAPFAVAWVTDIKLTLIPEAVYRRLPSLTSMPVNPNVLAGALVLGLPIPLALLLFDGSRMGRQERLACIAAVAGIGVMLVLTKSRGALMAGTASALVLGALRWGRRAWLVAAAGGLLAILAAWHIGFAEVGQRLSAVGATVGGPGRMEIWTRGVYLVQDFPWTGIGMGTFRQVTNALYPFLLLGPNADIPHAHNLFLQVAVDLGLPGLVAWLGILFAVTYAAWRVYRTGRAQGDAWTAGLGAGLLGTEAALVVHGLLDAAVWGAHSGLVVWALWGLTMAAYNLRRTPSTAPASAPLALEGSED